MRVAPLHHHFRILFVSSSFSNQLIHSLNQDLLDFTTTPYDICSFTRVCILSIYLNFAFLQILERYLHFYHERNNRSG
jgi:hypothetical protein